MDGRTNLHHLSYQAQAATWPFTAAATVLFILRLISRFVVARSDIIFEDVVVTLSWIFAMIRASFFQVGIDACRQVTTDNMESTVPSALFWTVFVDAWSYLSIPLPKLGVALLLVRIFRPHRWQRWTLLGLCWLLIVSCIAGFFLTVIQCFPPAGLWNPWKHPHAHCRSVDVAGIYTLVIASYSAVLDLIFSVYPGFVIMGLQMSRWKKMSTFAIMSLGFASCAFAFIKLDAAVEIIPKQGIFELLGHALKVGIWNSIENDVVLGAACLPETPPAICAICRLVGHHCNRLSLQLYRSLSEPDPLIKPNPSGRNLSVLSVD